MMTIVEVDSGEVVQSMQVLAEGCFPVVNVAVLSKNRGFLCPFFVAWMPFGLRIFRSASADFPLGNNGFQQPQCRDAVGIISVCVVYEWLQQECFENNLNQQCFKATDRMY